MDTDIQTNEFQTALTQELLDSLNAEIRDELLDIINNIEFIKRLISPYRKRAKDLEKDSSGKIIVDICNPHILEDMEYFRPTGNHFRKFGVLTKLKPNANPNSEFGKWIRLELDRIWYGMVRDSDGEWITGNMYFYLNYNPIIQTRIREGSKTQGDRILDFPEVWEGVYLMFHYIDQARKGGKYDNFVGGKHAVEIAKRGASKSYMLAAIFGKLFVCGENKISNKKVRGVVTAYQKESLIKDGTLNKFVDVIDFCAEHSQFPSKRLQSSLGDMMWSMGYKDLDTGVDKGTGNEMIGVTSKDNVEKSRGKRCNVFGYEEFGAFKNFIDIWMVNLPSVTDGDFSFGQFIAIGCVCANTIVYDRNGVDYLIQNINKDKGIIGFKNNNANIEEISYIHDYAYKKCINIETTYSSLRCSMDHPILIKRNIDDKINTNEIGFIESKDIKKNDLVAIIDKIDSWGNNTLKDFDYNEQIYYEDILRNDYKLLNKECVLKILILFLDTYGTVYNNNIIIINNNKQLCKKIVFLFRKLGIFSKIVKNKYSRNNSLYKIEINDDRSIYNLALQIKSNNSFIQKKLDLFVINNKKDYSENIRWDKIKKLKSIGIKRIYNITTSDSHTYIANNIITHNTGGSKDSDFSGALEIIYSPIGYKVYPLPNVFDKNSQGKTNTVFFFGAYLNRKGHYNKDGVSNVTSAIIEILKDRYTLKYNSSDVNVVARNKAENPITIQEAIMQTTSTIYPVSDLSDRLNEIDLDPSFYSDVYIGRIDLKDGKPLFIPDNSIRIIRNFPHKDNKLIGGIEIYKMPTLDSNGNITSGRYIGGLDPFDDDVSASLSLGSMIILDIFTDQIVAEYTGRPMFAEDFYENCRKLLLFYNARCNYENNKKGLFTHFSKMNSTYLLTETLEFLKDKDMIKGQSYGNKSYGTISTLPIKGYARRCIKDFLLKPVEKIVTIDGIEQTVTVRNLTTIKNRALLKELILWNDCGNFDRHDALGMLMLLREDKLRLLSGRIPSNEELSNNSNYLGNDDFFNQNFKPKENITI